jgi:hypothetical protein
LSFCKRPEYVEAVYHASKHSMHSAPHFSNQISGQNTMNHFVSTPLAALLSAALLASACSRTENAPAQAPQAARQASPNDTKLPPVPDANDPQFWAKASARKRAEALGAVDAKADRATPLASYRTIEGPADIAFAAAALSKAQPDYEKLATQLDPRFSQVIDGFKRKDSLERLMPRIEAGLAQARNSRYLRLELDQPQLGAFDFGRKGFEIKAIGSLATFGYNTSDARVRYLNGDQFAFLPVTDEAVARKIEALRSDFRGMRLEIFVFAAVADPLEVQSIMTEIVKLVLRDTNGTELASLSAGK